jgi:signal peptidase I
MRKAVKGAGRVAATGWAWPWLRALILALGFFLIVRSFLIEAFRIPTGSMENTLLAGDFLLVNKAVFGARVPLTAVALPALAEPRRGDLVVFAPSHDSDRTYVKRIVGAAGDTLAMRGKELFRNEQPVAESYARRADRSDAYAPAMAWQCAHAPAPVARGRCRPTRDNWGPVVVPPGHYFVLGDNRDASVDSRFWGFVARREIRGAPLAVYFSVDVRSGEIRWDRIGRPVH